METILLDPSASREALEQAKDICESINSLETCDEGVESNKEEVQNQEQEENRQDKNQTNQNSQGNSKPKGKGK